MKAVVKYGRYENGKVAVFMNSEFIGHLGSSVGNHGESTGEFFYCTTTTPINEVAKMKGYTELVYTYGEKVPGYL